MPSVQRSSVTVANVRIQVQNLLTLRQDILQWSEWEVIHLHTGIIT